MSKPVISGPWKNQLGEGSLLVTYDAFQKGFALKEVTFNQAAVALSRIWVNGLPTEDLKWFCSSRMTPDPQKGALSEKNNIYHLTFHTGWSWYREDKCTPLKVRVVYAGEERTLPPLVTCLKILGLKKVVEQTCLPDYTTPYSQYVVVYKGERVSDDYTLGELGIENGDEILITTQAELNAKPYGLQMSTRSEYVPTGSFINWYKKIQEKIGIVCLIQDPGKQDCGSGFLIGANLLMTCRHVLPIGDRGTILKGFRAKFFFEDNEKPVYVKLQKIIRFSPTPAAPFFRAKGKMLDYIVVSFIATRLSQEEEGKLALQAIIANKFFASARGKVVSTERNTKRATIIQHPDHLAKQIAFQENLIHEPSKFLLHYKTKTSDGTSGSPVINDEAELIGLHVTKCFNFDNKLFKAREALFKALELGNFKRDARRYYNFENDKSLEVYYRLENKGRWHRGPSDSLKPLLKLIKEKKKEFKNNKERASWAISTLQLDGGRVEIKKGLLKHVYCNRAIPAWKIIGDLQTTDGLKALEVEQLECKQKECLKREKIEEQRRKDELARAAREPKSPIPERNDRSDREPIINKFFRCCVKIFLGSVAGIYKCTLWYPKASMGVVFALFALGVMKLKNSKLLN